MGGCPQRSDRRGGGHPAESVRLPPVAGLAGKRQLLAALRSTLREGVEVFREAGEIHMLQLIIRFDGERGTRLAWFHHGICQEMYHRGQLALYQRLMGITPALTKLIDSDT